MTGPAPSTDGDVEARLREALAATTARLTALLRQHADVVAASQASNADDEHDPEGATIALERAQLAALVEQARRSAADVAQALARAEVGTYGVCERCGGPIGAGRLAARPAAVRCIGCAAPDRPPDVIPGAGAGRRRAARSG